MAPQFSSGRKKRKQHARTSTAKLKYSDHQMLWRVVEGAVADAFKSHDDYLTDRGRKHAINSVTKRVVGQLVGLVKEPQVGGGISHCLAVAGVMTVTAPDRTTGQAGSPESYGDPTTNGVDDGV